MKKYACLFRSITEKFANEKGETMAETLVAILVSSLALLMLAMAIGRAAGLVEISKKSIKTLYDNESDLVTGTVSTVSGSTSLRFEVPLRQDASGNGINDEPVVAYRDSENNIVRYERS